jgi:hypothetical protein
MIGLPEKHGLRLVHLYMYEYNLFRELTKDGPKPTDSIIIRQQHKQQS